MLEASQNPNIRILSYTELEEVKGYVGNFTVRLRKKPRFINENKCTGCGICIERCLTFAPDEWNLGLGRRKAVYKAFGQALPNVPVIDKRHCGHFTKGICSVCEKVCPSGAVDFHQREEVIEERFGAIVVAIGFEVFDHSLYGEYGAGRIKDVITGLHFERMLDPSGPTKGHIVRPSDFTEPKTVVFVQCVGSRDAEKGVPYCSGICCMYTAKHSILLKEHIPEAQAVVFYMDIRAPSKGYEEFIRRAQEEFGVLYIRGRVGRIFEEDGRLLIKAVDTLAGRPLEFHADLVVLATGVIAPREGDKVAQMLGLSRDPNGFFSELHPKLAPVETMNKGIYVAGCCQGPKDIPTSVAQGSAAAAKVIALFSKEQLESDPQVAEVRELSCLGCFKCRDVCPYGAIQEKEMGKRLVAQVVETVCHGCGLCTATCPTGAVQLRGFTDNQIMAELRGFVSQWKNIAA